jgi:hypothetical protein
VTAAAFNHSFVDFIDQLGEVPSPEPVREIKHNSKSLSVLEEDLDRLLQLGEGEATVRRGPPVFNYFLDSDDDATPLLGGHQGLMKRSTPLSELLHRKGMKPTKLLDLSLPHSATDSGELPF